MLTKILQKITSRQVLFIVLACELINISYYIGFFYKNHFLPAPFIMDKSNTFMDFYNPFYAVINNTFYTTFNSIYPALNYYILKIFSIGININQDYGSYEFRRQFPCLGWIVVFVYFLIIFIVVNLGEWKKFSTIGKFSVFFACALSVPVLFGLERANLIFWALLFLALYLNASNPWVRALFFGLLVNIKPYFAILLLQYLNIHTFKRSELGKCIAFSALIFFLLGYFSNMNILNFFKAYFLFGRGSVLSADGVIALPHSLPALNAIKTFVFVGVSHPHYTAWFSLLKVFGYLAVFILVLLLIMRRLNDLESLIGCFFVLSNFSISTGGYILIIYIVLIPYLINSTEYKKFIFPILVIYALPVDWIKILNVHLADSMSYLDGETILINPTFWIGFGSILRPLLNFSMMIYFIVHLLNKYPIESPWVQKFYKARSV